MSSPTDGKLTAARPASGLVLSSRHLLEAHLERTHSSTHTRVPTRCESLSSPPTLSGCTEHRPPLSLPSHLLFLVTRGRRGAQGCCFFISFCPLRDLVWKSRAFWQNKENKRKKKQPPRHTARRLGVYSISKSTEERPASPLGTSDDS